MQQPTLEKIAPSFGSSFAYSLFDERCENSAPYWHIHPELEIVYLPTGTGKRHVGNHISYYHDGDLLMVGSNVPHFGFSDRMQGSKTEVVVQMLEHFLGKDFFALPEMNNIRQLFQRAKQGISFYGDTKEEAGARLLDMALLHPFDRLVAFLKVLEILASSTEYQLLNAEAYTLNIVTQDHTRIDAVYQYVRQHFDGTISLDEIAKEVNMTVPAFCRYFKKITHKTFTQFVNEYRVVQACKLLTEGTMSIADVCFESGFNNVSHFNKHFRQITGKSPSAYRKERRQVVGA